MLVNLTLAQAEGDDNAMKILTNVNEKVAINTFANGLRNRELRTIIKARNYQSLKAAIGGAKDEDRSNVDNNQAEMLHMRGKNSNGGFYRNYRGRNFSDKINYRGSSRGYKQSNYNSYKNSANQHTQQNNNYRGQGRVRYDSVNKRGRGHGLHRAYFAENVNVSDSNSKTEESAVSANSKDWFFRSQTE